MTGPGEVRVVEDFTADHGKVIGEIQKLAFRAAERADIDRSLNGLLSATKMLATLPERKMLVYFLPQPLPGLVGNERLQPIIEAAQRANVAFFGITVPRNTYVIGAGDVLSIHASGAPEEEALRKNLAAQRFTVRPNGVISFPLLGDIQAAGLTPEELQSEIESRLLAKVKAPQVTINIVAIHLGNSVRTLEK